jgi:tripartite-type tricarboxylate transporter receptor subunit TctC
MRGLRCKMLQMFKIKHIFLAILLAALGATLGSAPARAEYPERTIKIIVPFSPGGGTDIVARLLADFLGRDLGKTVIIENRPGSGTIIGTEAAANSAPDGYTLVLATIAHAANPSLYAKLPYDTFKAFAPVALLARSFNLVVVNPKAPFKTIADLIADAKANPGKLNYGSFGYGTSAHLAAELFNALAGVQLTQVPYKGAAPAITDLLGGQIDVIFTTVASAAAYVEAKQLRALAVTSAKRSDAFPDLPTVAEAGVPGYAAEAWYALYAPAGTPADVLARLNTSVNKAIAAGAFRMLATNEGLIFAPGSPEDLDRFVRAEAARWHEVIAAAHIQMR